MIGSTEALVIGAVVFFLFGSESLKRLARALGESKREIDDAEKEFEELRRP